MKQYLLDTHSALWFFDDNPALSDTADAIISDDSVSKYLSIASAWEVAIKINIGKLSFDNGVDGFLQAAEANKIIILPIKNAHLSVYETLPVFHRDPFDRLLIATAIAEDMIMITDDRHIPQYDVSVVW